MQLFHLSNAYSLCCTNTVICAFTVIVLSQLSHLYLCEGLGGSLVVIWGGRPLLILSFYGHVSSEDTRVLVILASSLFRSLTADAHPSLSNIVTIRCCLSWKTGCYSATIQRLSSTLCSSSVEGYCRSQSVAMRGGVLVVSQSPPGYVTSRRGRGGFCKPASCLHRIPPV